MPVCDGCGANVDAEHIRERIERLELATRFRPVHIQVLLIDAAPPARLGDYFYQAAPEHRERSPDSAEYFREVMQCAGLVPSPETPEESLLAHFQRRGFFLTYALECPAGDREGAAAIRLRAPTVLKRVQYSYRPKCIVLLSPSTAVLVETFEGAEWKDRLIGDTGHPFSGVGFGKRVYEASSVLR